MIMICVIHMNLFIKSHPEIIPQKEYVDYFGFWTQSVGIIGVNLYALITGYVCVSSKWRYARYFRLWVLVAFYTVFLAGVGYVLNYTGVTDEPVDILHYSEYLLFGSTYWYFAAYTGLFFIIPFLNSALKSIAKERYILLILVLALLLPVVNRGDCGALFSSGYNMIWLTVMYVVGAYIKLYPPVRYRSSTLLLCALFCSFISGGGKLVGINLAFFSYSMLNNVLYSIVLFIVFTRLNVVSPMLRRLITLLAPAAFSVYLIQCHPWVWNVFVSKMAICFLSLDCPWWFSLVFGMLLYFAATVIDFGRIALFRICRVNIVADYIAARIETAVKAVLPKLKRLLE